jgi:hypothetical protein
MHLCTCVSEEGGDGEAACSETPSLQRLLVVGPGVMYLIGLYHMIFFTAGQVFLRGD